MFWYSAKQRKRKSESPPSELPASYPTSNISLKEMLYDPYLVPMGYEEAEDDDDEDDEKDYES